MASTRRASIGAEIRADRSKFKADLDAAKRDAKAFTSEVRQTFSGNADAMRTLSNGLVEAFRRGQGQIRKDMATMVQGIGADFSKQAFTPIQKVVTMRRRDAFDLEDMKNEGKTFEDPAFVRRTRAEIQGLTRDTLTANTAMMQGGKGATNAGMGMLFLSQTIDDAQYGFKGIVNNIAPLVMALGGSAGLAGVLTIAAVGFNLLGGAAEKAWKKMSGQEDYEKLMARNAEMEAAHERRLALMVKEAQMRGQAEIQLTQDVEAAEDRRRAGEERTFEGKMELKRLEEELAQVRLTGLSEGEKALTLAEREKKAAAERLALEERFYKERLANSEADQKAAEKRLSALKEEKRALEDRQNAGRLSSKEQARLAEVSAGVTATQAAVDAGDDRRREDQQGLAGVEQRRREQAVKDQITDEQVKEQLRQQGEEMAKQGFGEVVSFLTNLNDRAKEANAANKKAWEQEQEKAKAEQRRADTVKQLEIETLRAQGKGKQADALQADFDKEQNIRRLEAEGFSPEAAARMAGQMAENAAPARQRGGRIKGAISKNRSSEWFDFDAFQNERIGYDFEQQKTKLNNQRGEARQQQAAAAAAGDKEAVQKLEQVVQRLDTLISAAGKTAGERAKPKNAA